LGKQLLATKEAAKHHGQNGGSIINISSTASAGEAQAAIRRGLAAELGPRKIRMNAIAPGEVETDGTHSGGIIGSDFEIAMIARTPLGASDGRTTSPPSPFSLPPMISHGLPTSGSRQRAAADNIARYCIVPFEFRLTSSTTNGPEGTRSELISCVAAEASSAVLKDRLSADRRCLNSLDAIRPAALATPVNAEPPAMLHQEACARHAGRAIRDRSAPMVH
jgi:hypothetical protein